MAALTGSIKLIERAARDHFTAMTYKRVEHLMQVKRFGLAVVQRDDIDTEDRLKLGL